MKKKRDEHIISQHMSRIEYALIGLVNAESEKSVDACIKGITESLAILSKEVRKGLNEK